MKTMKKNKTIIKLILAGAIVTVTTISCKKSYLDINQNPNSAESASVVELLPSAEAAIAHVVGNNFQIFGGLWGQYWTQSPASSQYKTIDSYAPAANDFDRPWKALYADALQDLSNIEKLATSESKFNHVACSKILQAYTYQLLTDNFGSVPFSEAIQATNDILSPKYDNEQAIYSGIIKLLEDADALIDESSDIHPGSEDLLLGGDMSLWRKFGNTLKLRVYLRLAYVDPATASSGIAALETAGAEFLGAGEEVKLNYGTEGGRTNPLYSSIIGVGGTQNLVASATAMDYMTTNNDPRVETIYFEAVNGAFVGIPQGAYTLPAGTIVSYPGTATGGYGADDASALAPVRLLTGYESLFLQSEAVVRTYLTGDAQALYEEAITENFASFSVTDTFTLGYFAEPAIAFPTAGTSEDQIKAIITQKWVALNGNSGTEGWTEWRRTGYPDFFTESVNSIIGAGRLPARCFYPTSEVTRNANFPGQKLVYEKVWWDVN